MKAQQFKDSRQSLFSIFIIVHINHRIITLFSFRMATIGSKNAALLLGKTVKLSKIGIKQIPCVQIRCRENEYDDYLKMYFAKSIDYWALDKTGDVQLGDSVLIQPVDSANRIASTVTHNVNKIITRFGTKIDPVTKKRILNNVPFEKIDLKSKMVNKRTGFVRDQ